MLVTRTIQGYMCATIVRGTLVHRHYIGYTRREAMRLFRWDVKQRGEK